MKRSKRFLALVCLLVLVSIFAMACSKKEEPKAEGKYKAGTYEAAAKGYGGDVAVSVTLSADKIDAIEVKENKETPDIGGKAMETLKETVLKEQKVEVDAVAGATVSSKAFLEAVTQAVKKGQ